MTKPTPLLIAAVLVTLGGCASAERIEVSVGDTVRSAFLHVPPSGGAGAPLLMVFHGGGSSSSNRGRGMAGFTGFNEIADREDFVVVYPNSLRGNWNDGRDGTDAVDVDDVAFISALLDDVQQRVAFDEGRVYSTGISNGGFFSQRLACDLSDRVTAVYAVAATIPEAIVEGCNPGRAVPVAIAAGTDDPLVLFEGGQVAKDRGLSLSAEDAVAHWVRHNGCTSQTTATLDDTDTDDGSTIDVTDHGDCRDGVHVRFLKIDGGGHTWPGGTQYAPQAIIGGVNGDIDMSEEVWTFVSAFSR